jgi:hypothetical protein
MPKTRTEIPEQKIVRAAKWDAERVRKMQELRRSNAAGLHSTPKNYSRKVKHPNRQEW